ncbi:hypothetical protein SprV_0100246300 [Sparganum proliferum]
MERSALVLSRNLFVEPRFRDTSFAICLTFLHVKFSADFANLSVSSSEDICSELRKTPVHKPTHPLSK